MPSPRLCSDRWMCTFSRCSIMRRDQRSRPHEQPTRIGTRTVQPLEVRIMRRPSFVYLVSAGLAFALLLVSPAGATLEGAPPTTVVRATLDTVFHILDDQ